MASQPSSLRIRFTTRGWWVQSPHKKSKKRNFYILRRTRNHDVEDCAGTTRTEVMGSNPAPLMCQMGTR